MHERKAPVVIEPLVEDMHGHELWKKASDNPDGCRNSPFTGMYQFLRMILFFGHPNKLRVFSLRDFRENMIQMTHFTDNQTGPKSCDRRGNTLGEWKPTLDS